MVERSHLPAVATFYAPGEWTARLSLDESAAHHAVVKRLNAGDAVRLTSGNGRRANGVIAELGKRRLEVTIDLASVEQVIALPRIELWAPVADRDRMFMLAEKAVELGVNAWRSVIYARSKSVSPRGEGAAFHEKLRLRQISALEQSGGAWLPELHPEVRLDEMLAARTVLDEGTRLLLDTEGEGLGDIVATLDTPVHIALGPEGGLDEEERVAFIRAGWRPVSLGANVLRFETAAIAAVAVVRSHHSAFHE